MQKTNVLPTTGTLRKIAAAAGLTLALPMLTSVGANAQELLPAPTARSLDHACPADETPRGAFRDVALNDTHGLAIDCAAAYGFVQGGPNEYDPDQYVPNGSLTRAQLASILARVIDVVDPTTLPEWDGEDQFTDVPEGDVHREAINRLASVGIVVGGAYGTPGDQFSPGGHVQRAHMATMIARLHRDLTGDEFASPGNHFNDLDGFLPEHVENINALAGAGIAVGGGAGGSARSFYPLDPIDRDQVASFVMREVDLLAELAEQE